MISGTHVIIYTKDAEADRAFFKDVLGFKHIDAHDGWLIFSLPPAELACHPYEKNNVHELFFMCKDINAEINYLKSKNISCSELTEHDWGTLTKIKLPGGGEVGLYQPKHKTAIETS